MPKPFHNTSTRVLTYRNGLTWHWSLLNSYDELVKSGTAGSKHSARVEAKKAKKEFNKKERERAEKPSKVVDISWKTTPYNLQRRASA